MTFSKLFLAWLAGDHRRRDPSATYPSNSLTFPRGGHGLFSTAPDYMRFAQMLANGGKWEGERIMGRRTLQLMHSNHIPAAHLAVNQRAACVGLWLWVGFTRVMMDVAQSGIRWFSG